MKYLLLAMLSLLLTACAELEQRGIIHDRTTDYKYAQQTPTIVAPKGTTLAVDNKNLYAIPANHTPTSNNNLSIYPPGLPHPKKTTDHYSH